MSAGSYSYLGSRTDALPWLFVSERRQPLTRQSVNYLVARAPENGIVSTGVVEIRHSRLPRERRRRAVEG